MTQPDTKEPGSPRGRLLQGVKRRWMPVCLALALLAHTGLVLRNFPVSALREGRALSSIELAFHLAGAMEGRDFLADRHHVWGYSVRYMAGYPFGLWNSIGTRGYESAAALFPWCSLGAAFNLWVIVTAWLPPLLVALACWLVTGDRRLSLLTLLFGLLVYHLGNITTYFWFTGMIAFVVASSLAVLFTALVWRTIERSSWAASALAGLVLAAIVWINTLAVVPAAFGALAAAGAGRGRLFRGRTLLRLAFVPALALAVLSPWLVVLWRFRDLRNYMDLARIPSGVKYAIMDFLSDRRYLHHFDRRALLHVTTVLAAAGLAAGWRKRDGTAVFGWPAAGLLVSAYAFAYSRFLDQTEPYRYLSSMELFAFIPAAAGLGWLGRTLRGANTAGRLAVLSLALMVTPSLTGYGFDWVYRLQRPATSLDAVRLSVVERLRQQGPLRGRVLCEDKRLGNVLPYYLDVEVIGGTIGDESVLPNTWAGVGANGVFGPAIRPRMAAAGKLGEYLRLYNVAAVVAISPGLADDLVRGGGAFASTQQMNGCTLLFTDPAQLGAVCGAEGEAAPRVEAGPNRLTVTGAPPGRFVLKYHYLPTLRPTAGVTLFPERRGEDPVPFIGVDNPAGLSTIEIRHAYGGEES